MLAQLLTNRDNNDTRNNHNEEHNDDEQPKTEKSKENSSIDAEVLKGIQAQIASLAQRDELKKVGTTRPYPLEWDSVPYSPKFKPPTLHTYDGKPCFKYRPSRPRYRSISPFLTAADTIWGKRSPYRLQQKTAEGR